MSRILEPGRHDETTPLLSSRDDGSIESNSQPLLCNSSSDQDHDHATSTISTQSDSGADIEAGETVENTSESPTTQPIDSVSFVRIVVVLMIGIFTSGLDGSLLLATHPRIASEFNALEDSSWLFISFLLAGAATQILYAKLSDIYGRKILVVLLYLVCLRLETSAIIGMSREMWQVILGRTISGSGAFAMSSLGLVLITDLIPLRDIATWFGYMNVVATTGRGLGGPIGGFLADRVGWRWSFLGQTPLFVAAIIGSIFVIPNTRGTAPETTKGGTISRFARIDFPGSLLLGVTVLLFMLPLEIGGVKVAWTHPLISGLFGAGFITLCVFIANEAWWAKEPAIPVRLLKHREIIASYFIIACMSGAQTALMCSVPLYFQVTTRASNTNAGLHLVPAVVGNAIGGLVTGALIRRTGRYKSFVIAASISASISYVLIIIRWHGHTNWVESLYIFPGGFGAGMSSSGIFVGINAVVEPSHKAVVASGLNLSMPIGMVLGVAASSAVMLQMLQRTLDTRLIELGLNLEARAQIIEQAAASVDFIKKLQGPIAEAVIDSYIIALRYSHVVILGFSVSALFAGFLL
ncbi:MFS general substrate transporter [Biscogniauxia marginata]|nr:MFS general substrate transporter [Biscogniauxia marginata]